jgi:serine/threonine protein kinase
LKDPNAWSPEFRKFITYCLNKDPKNRPTAELALQYNEDFLKNAKDKSYLVGTLLKGVPSVQDRYCRVSRFKEFEDNEEDNDNLVE